MKSWLVSLFSMVAVNIVSPTVIFTFIACASSFSLSFLLSGSVSDANKSSTGFAASALTAPSATSLSNNLRSLPLRLEASAK
ncbi:hypothetical protein D3C80_1959210 [compost metagenome]